MDNSPKRDCSPRSRCERTRDCDYCAAARQRKIGDVAEAIEREHGQLTMTVLKPIDNTAAEIKRLHARFMRRSLAPAGIWTVEKGEQFGRLHLNYISPKPIPDKWKRCETYTELLEVTARDAAAYITKRSGMPDKKQYAGRLYGSWGKVGEILVSKEMIEAAPIVTAATMEAALSGKVGEKMKIDGIEYRTAEEERKGWKEGAPVEGRRVWWTLDGKEWTYKPPAPKGEDYKAIGRKHLPELYAALRKTVQV